MMIGTSGWSYAHWRRVFYPESMPSGSWFSYYARYFDTVEVNNSFYGLPGETTLARWRGEAPRGFVFAVKASRFITHMKKIRNTGDAVSAFLDRMSCLGRNLGPILFQLPPNLRFDEGRFRDFLAELPPRRRYCVEFRDPSWLNERSIRALADRKVAFCIHDLLDTECPEHVTAGFAYFRFHGRDEKYGGSYPMRVLRKRAETMAAIHESGRDVYAYFNNDAFGHALKNAVALRKLVSEMITGWCAHPEVR